MENFKGIPMILFPKENEFKSVSVVSKTYDYYSEFEFTDSSKEQETFIPFVEIKDDNRITKKNRTNKKY